MLKYILYYGFSLEGNFFYYESRGNGKTQTNEKPHP